MSSNASKTKKSAKVAVNADDAAAVLDAINSYWSGTGGKTSEELHAAVADVLAGKRLPKKWAVEEEAEEPAGDDTKTE